MTGKLLALSYFIWHSKLSYLTQLVWLSTVRLRKRSIFMPLPFPICSTQFFFRLRIMWIPFFLTENFFLPTLPFIAFPLIGNDLLNDLDSPLLELSGKRDAISSSSFIVPPFYFCVIPGAQLCLKQIRLRCSLNSLKR